MNKAQLWVTGIVVVVIGLLIASGVAVNHTVVAPVVAPVTTDVTFYDQKSGESTAASFADRSVTFTNAKFGTMILPQVISADGGRYANTDESIVFWNKGEDVTITQDGKVVFTGSTSAQPATAPVSQGKLPAGSKAPGDAKGLIGTWMWQKTTLTNGSVVTPKKAGVFALTFTADGRVSGKTDCNGVGGEYMAGSDGILSFGPFMSTLMYCEGSQEAVFSSELTSVHRYTLEANGTLSLVLDKNAGTMIFAKK